MDNPSTSVLVEDQPVAAPERCDMDGTAMRLLASGHGFERWQCPTCTRRVVIDRDEETSVRGVAWRGQPWLWPASAFEK